MIPGIGIALTLVVTVGLYAVWGSAAILPGLIFGALATALQAAAVRGLPTKAAEFDRLARQWGVGVGLRFAGVVLVAIAVLVDRDRFPPIPTAFGFLGVMIPLLFLELKRLR